MPTSPLRKLVVQISHYSFASTFGLLAGLITFPLLTHTFSVADYGIMNLISATLGVSVALAKLGLQHSLLRYYSEVRTGKIAYTISQLFSTSVIGMLAASLVVVVVVNLGGVGLLLAGKAESRVVLLGSIASVLIIIQTLESSLTNYLRAEMRTRVILNFQLAKKALTLAMICLVILGISKTLGGFYAATITSEALAITGLGYALFRSTDHPSLGVSHFSRPLYVGLLRLGLPMMIGYEMAGIVLSVGDRYIIAGMLGPEPLGLYSAAYNLCEYVQAVALSAVGQAMMPTYMRMWDEKGSEATTAFVARSLRLYTLLAAPVIAGLGIVGPELLPSLASAKYATASHLIPWIIAGMVFDGANSMVGAGLYIHRRTKTISVIVLCGALLNVGLNVVLIPRIGVLGAAVATLISYGATSTTMLTVGRKQLPVPLPLRSVAGAALASAAMYALLYRFYPGHKLVTVGVRAVLGVAFYGVAIAAIDPDARGFARLAWDKVRSLRGRD